MEWELWRPDGCQRSRQKTKSKSVTDTRHITYTDARLSSLSTKIQKRWRCSCTERVAALQYELGQPRCWHTRLATYVPLNFTYLDVIFWRGVDAPTNKWKACLFVCFCPRNIWPIQRSQKYKGDHNLSEKKRKKGRQGSICVHMRFKHEVTNSDRNSQNWAGHRSYVITIYVFIV